MLKDFMMRLAWNMPALLCYFIGFVLAIAKRRSLPKAWAFLMTGCLIGMGTRVVMMLAYFFVFHRLVERGVRGKTFEVTFMGMGAVDNLLSAISVCLVLVAIYVGRGSSVAQTPAPAPKETEPPRPTPLTGGIS